MVEHSEALSTESVLAALAVGANVGGVACAVAGTADTTVDATAVRGGHSAESISQAVVVDRADNGDRAVRTSPAGIADAAQVSLASAMQRAHTVSWAVVASASSVHSGGSAGVGSAPLQSALSSVGSTASTVGGNAALVVGARVGVVTSGARTSNA